MAGEAEHAKGRHGARLAKKWLDRTMRVEANLLNPDGVAKKKLTLKKANHQAVNDVFSFDLGGRFRDGELEGQEFLAECKNYVAASDLPTHYRDFLAHCYRAVDVDHHMADQFMWISFAPHGTTTWDKLTEADAVKKAVLNKNCHDINFRSGEDPAKCFSEEIAKKVSERLWLLILSEKQCNYLTITSEHHAVIESHIIASASEGPK